MKGIYGALAFVAGLAVGATAGGFYFKNHFEKLSEEKVRETKEFYRKKREEEDAVLDGFQVKKELDTLLEKVDEVLEVPEERKAVPKTRDLYADYSKPYRSDISEKPVKKNEERKPQIITEQEFSDDMDYETVGLTHYHCGTIANDDDIELSREEVDAMIGLSTLVAFGEYESDVIYVRNHDTKTNYEVLMNELSYEEVVGNKPHLIGG